MIVTHFIDFSPQHLGVDYVTAACGRYIAITSFSGSPTCPDPRCQVAARKHLLQLRAARTRQLT